MPRMDCRLTRRVHVSTCFVYIFRRTCCRAVLHRGGLVRDLALPPQGRATRRIGADRAFIWQGSGLGWRLHPVSRMDSRCQSTKT